MPPSSRRATSAAATPTRWTNGSPTGSALPSPGAFRAASHPTAPRYTPRWHGRTSRRLVTDVEDERGRSRCSRVEAKLRPPSPWRCECVREIQRLLHNLRPTAAPTTASSHGRSQAVAYAGKARQAKANELKPLSTTSATRAERSLSLLCCHVRRVSVGARPWLIDVSR
jgi:hypothetical protein